jgi:hypothetical protein
VAFEAPRSQKRTDFRFEECLGLAAGLIARLRRRVVGSDRQSNREGRQEYENSEAGTQDSETRGSPMPPHLLPPSRQEREGRK